MNGGSKIGLVKALSGIVLTACLCMALLPAAASAKPKKKKVANLVVTAVTDAPTPLVAGTEFTVTDTTKNSGKKTAKASATRYYLTTNPTRSLADRKASKTNPRTSFEDFLLIGAREVPALGKGKSSPGGAVTVTVPGGVLPASYKLLACADDRGEVKEKPEDDNCKAAVESSTLNSPGGEGRPDGFSDVGVPLPPAFEALLPQLLSAFACGGGPQPKNFSLPAALTSAENYLTQTAGADAMAAFAATPAYDTAEGSEEAAGQAMLSNSPGAALAAMLRAHELEPDEASHLVNAGGLLAAIGRPNEAIADWSEFWAAPYWPSCICA